MSAQQRQKCWFDTGEKAEEATPGKQDKDKCLPPRRAAPGAGTLIPCYLHGVGPGGPESRKSSRDGGTPGRGPQAWAAGPADTRERTGSGERGASEGRGGGTDAEGREQGDPRKLSCVQRGLLQRRGVTSRQMRPTPYERRGGYRRRGGSGLRGCRTPGLGDSRACSGWAEGLESGGRGCPRRGGRGRSVALPGPPMGRHTAEPLGVSHPDLREGEEL